MKLIKDIKKWIKNRKCEKKQRKLKKLVWKKQPQISAMETRILISKRL